MVESIQENCDLLAKDPDTVLIENPADGIESVIIESAKFPDRPPSVSIRCDPQASDLLFETEDEYAWRWMAGRLADLPFLAAEPEERQVKRWRYSKPAAPDFFDNPWIRAIFQGDRRGDGDGE